jgi:HAMP domain-containing protein
MPSLIRFLAAVLVLAGLAFAGLWALANLVEPQQREMSVTIQPEKIGR